MFHRALVVSTLAVALIASPASSVSQTQAAAASLTVTRNEAEQHYPATITFRLEVQPTSKPGRLTLLYHTSGRTCVQGVVRQPVDFTPGSPLKADWVWDLRFSDTLPPGVTISWQWEVADESGHVTLTPEKTATITDKAFDWKRLTRPGLVVHWADGSDDFGASLADIAEASLKRAAASMKVKPGGDVHLWIYPNAQALKAALIFTPEWLGGEAFPDYATVLLAVSPSEMTWAKSGIPHELMHLVVGQRIFNCQAARLPTWLNEGLAVQAETDVNLHSTLKVITTTVSSGRIESLRALANGFQSDSHLASVAYAWSGRIAAFLIAKGAEKMAALLDHVQQGDTIDDALQAVYGFDTDGLDTAWRQSVGLMPRALATSTPTPASSAKPKRTPVPTLALWTAVPQSPQPHQTQTPVANP